jgi:hypothetical protein
MKPLMSCFSLLTTKSDLLAYPRPNDIKQYRNEAALIIKSWKDADREFAEQHNRNIPSHKTGNIHINDNELFALTIQTDSGNVLIRAVQPCLLLVLVGCKPKSTRSKPEQFTSEAKGDARYPAILDAPPPVIDFSANIFDDDDDEELSPTTLSATRASSTYKAKSSNSSDHQGQRSPTDENEEDLDANLDDKEAEEQQSADLLYLQRDKLDAMADWLAARLSEKEFRMKEDNS